MTSETLTVRVDVLRELVGAAESYAEDLSSGLADGTYEEDPGLAAIEEAIEIANANLAGLD